jgi:sirohydrochlorin ferrochelatase
MSTTGYIVFAHGSSVESANQAVRDVTRELSRRGGIEIAEAAFLEGGQPDLAGAVQRLAERDIRHLVVIPYFLTLGLHLRRDLPCLVETVKRLHPGLHIEVREPLDGHPALVEALLDRALLENAQETA